MTQSPDDLLPIIEKLASRILSWKQAGYRRTPTAEAWDYVELVASELNTRTSPPMSAEDMIPLTAAIGSIIGYTSSLKPGVVNEGYINRLNDYYVPNLEKALEQHSKIKVKK